MLQDSLTNITYLHTVITQTFIQSGSTILKKSHTPFVINNGGGGVVVVVMVAISQISLILLDKRLKSSVDLTVLYYCRHILEKALLAKLSFRRLC